MFGRVRASPLPIECLELERPPPKMLKDDSLSVYEATLMKLKQGSRRIGSSPDQMVDDAVILDHNNQLKLCSILPESSMNSELSSASEGATTENHSSEKASTKQNEGIACISDSDSSVSTAQEGRNMSILYLFSKYKQQSSYNLKEKGFQNDEDMDVEEECLTDDSTCFGDIETTSVLNQHTLY